MAQWVAAAEMNRLRCLMISICSGRRRRHLQAKLTSGEPQIETAGRAVARPNHCRPCTAATQGVAAAVEPEAAHLLCGTMAPDAVLLKNRLDVAGEIDFRRRSSRELCEVVKRPGDDERGRDHESEGDAVDHDSAG